MGDKDDNDGATIVKEISHISFTALTTLHLAYNQVESIEGLPRVSMPQIEQLKLCICER